MSVVWSVMTHWSCVYSRCSELSCVYLRI